nr:DEAD/DEAH box helicase [Brevibacillus sp. SYP-B805]
MQIPASFVEHLTERNIVTPTPVQTAVIPPILAGKDVLAESPTGSGKTLAYLLPLCARLDAESKEIQGLILAPTHELAMQIFREAERVLAVSGLHAVALIGGVDPKRQLEKLKTRPAVVVATPGRLKELLEQRKVKVHTVKTVVVDEADRLLDEGFAAAVRDVLRRLMRDTQRLFFSATLPESIVSLIEPLVKEPVIIRAEAPASRMKVLHFYLVSEGRKKVDTLRRLLRLVNARSAIVFVNTLEKVEEIVAKLRYHHLECRLLHRDASKEERAHTLQQFRAGAFPVLIATDVAARGIDIPGVECVVHFDPAADADAYVHRSGRTGRMGAAGLVFSIIEPRERFILEKFSKRLNLPIVEKAMSYGALVDPADVRKKKPPGKAAANGAAGKPDRGTKPPHGTRSGMRKR